MRKKKVQVFIITRNRTDSLVTTLDSVMNQDFEDYEVIVSDNSTNDLTKELLNEEKYKSIKYIQRNPQYETGIDHINAIHKEATSEYYMIFHDDDEMLPFMVRKLYEAIVKDKRIAAAAGNAFIVKGRHISKSFKEGMDVVLNDGEALIKRYNEGSIAPYPSYMYHKAVIDGLSLNKEEKGGKYCDVSSIFDFACKGPILYLGEPLMNYNIHEGQDSMLFEFSQHVQLTNYLLRQGVSKAALTNLRLYHIYNFAIEGYKDKSIQFSFLVARVLFKYSFNNYFLKYIIRFIQNKFYA